LLGATLETVLGAFSEPELDINTSSIRLLVDELSKNATTIISECEGTGLHFTCPFFSAYEVHLFYKFSLSFLSVWSGHEIGKDEDEDAAFYSQIGSLCEILNSLDTAAVPLSPDITESIQSLKREVFWPNWFVGERIKGEVTGKRCLAIGKAWILEESEAYQKALATMTSSTQLEAEFQLHAHNSIIMFLLSASASKSV
jgi:hypothetical protein